MTELPTFDLRLVPSFVVLAEELHFGRAAERLLIAQPALSRQIAKLEEQLGATLLLRSSRGATLTPAGELFLAAGRDIIERAERARAAALNDTDELIVHLGDALNPHSLHIVTTFADVHREVRLNVMDGTSTGASAAVQSGRAHIGFDVLEGAPASLNYASVDRNPLGLACAHDHRLSTRSAITWQDLAGEQLIMSPPGVADGYNFRLRTALRSAGVAFREAAGASRVFLLAGRLSAGPEVLLCPRYAFSPWPESLTWVPIDPPADLDIGIIWDDLADPATALFVAWAAALSPPVSPGLPSVVARATSPRGRSSHAPPVSPGRIPVLDGPEAMLLSCEHGPRDSGRYRR